MFFDKIFSCFKKKTDSSISLDEKIKKDAGYSQPILSEQEFRNFIPNSQSSQIIPNNVDFNYYILKAVDYLVKNYSNLGYDIQHAYTHDLRYGDRGIIKSMMGGKTMCVAAMQELIITAMQIYDRETGDDTVWDFLPFSSWVGWSIKDIHAHIWVNPQFNSYGTADALYNFGMGQYVHFNELIPGDFINFNRSNGSGHAVCFISYLNENGEEVSNIIGYKIIGFKYFSAQGDGLSYRYAFFNTAGNRPTLSSDKKRDIHIIYSENPKILNIGRMLHPELWQKRTINAPTSVSVAKEFFHPLDFDGKTYDDTKEYV
jgi:hypothetical protein